MGWTDLDGQIKNSGEIQEAQIHGSRPVQVDTGSDQSCNKTAKGRTEENICIRPDNPENKNWGIRGSKLGLYVVVVV